MKCLLKGESISPDYRLNRFNTKVSWLQQKAEYRNDHQKQAAWLAADESDEYSTDSELRARNVILLTIYGLAPGRVMPRKVGTAVSPDFMKGLATAKTVRSTPSSG